MEVRTVGEMALVAQVHPVPIERLVADLCLAAILVAGRMGRVLEGADLEAEVLPGADQVEPLAVEKAPDQWARQVAGHHHHEVEDQTAQEGGP